MKRPNQTSSIGFASARLSTAEKRIWYEVISAVPEGVLRPADRLIVDMAARLIFTIRQGRGRPSDRRLLRSVLYHCRIPSATRTEFCT